MDGWMDGGMDGWMDGGMFRMEEGREGFFPCVTVVGGGGGRWKDGCLGGWVDGWHPSRVRVRVSCIVCAIQSREDCAVACGAPRKYWSTCRAGAFGLRVVKNGSGSVR